MFKLRKEHFAAMQEAETSAFLRAATAYVKEAVPARLTADLKPDQLRRRVERAVDAGKKIGLVTNYQLACYLEASFLLGEKFESDPKQLPAQLVVRSKSLTPREKADGLLFVAQRMTSTRDPNYKPSTDVASFLDPERDED